MSWLRRPRFPLVALAFVLALPSPALAAVLPVSPGATDRLVDVTSACPTFAWSGVDGAVAYEIAVLDVGDAENPLLVYRQRIDGAAFAWAPSREECLAPGGVYAWLVRADVAGGGLGAWSAPRRFRVPGAPSIEELTAALAVVDRWRAAQGSMIGGAATAPAAAAAREPASTTDGRDTAATDAPLAAGVAAIRGEIPDTTGSAFGVFGITHSAAGAGVVARNEAAGPDLVLDGEAQGQADTRLTQGGIDRPSAAAQTFDIGNSGAGALSLTVDGVAVSKEGHTHAGEAITSGTVADARVASTLARDSEVLSIVLAGDGSGSAVDADLVDGSHASSFAGSSHVHAGEAITSGTVAEARIATALARDSEVMPLVLGADGPGSGLDADTVDGWSSSDFSAPGHTHHGESWTGLEVLYALGLVNHSADYYALAANNFSGTAIRASGGGEYKSAILADTSAPYGRGVHGRTYANLGFGLFGEAFSASGSGVGVFGVSSSVDGLGGRFENWGAGTALSVGGSGQLRDSPALKVANANALGTAAYLWVSSSVATIHVANVGNGEVLYLQNGGTDEFGAGGNDFIRAVNQPENDSQFRVSTEGLVYSDVGFTTPAADFAEMLPAVSGLEAGDVLAIDSEGRLARSGAAFASNVAGVFSTAPGFLGGHPVEGEAPADQVPLAVIGVVPVKVSAENGPIAPGDLLVSSATPGHAMRAGVLAPNGTVIGKALEPHSAGLGRIRMLLVLQ